MKENKSAYKTKFEWSYLKPVYWPSWVAVFFLLLIAILPLSVSDKLAYFLGGLARRINAKRRRIARQNIELCFPSLSEQEKKNFLRRNFRAQIRSVLHYGVFWWMPVPLLKRYFEIKGQENIEASRQAGRSVILLAAHSVALEASLAISYYYPVTGFIKIIKNKLINWLVFCGRSRLGAVLYRRESGLRPIIKDVRAGQVLLYFVDEDLGRERSIFAPFFGIEKATVPVLGRLAGVCNADVLPCMACYDEEQHKYVINVMPTLDDFPQQDDMLDAIKMNQYLEQAVNLCPDQYFWTFRLFRTRPGEEDKFY